MKKKSFDKFMSEHQVAWRKDNITDIRQGSQNKVRRPWILHKDAWEQGLWDELRSGGNCPVKEYTDKMKVKIHTGSHNLKSSWISGVNLYFPFRQNEYSRALLASFLRARVNTEVEMVDSVELEFAEKGNLSPDKLLGESGGSRGSGQTSPDIAFIVNNGKGLLLVENKLTEHSFYPCSALTTKGSATRPENTDKTRCQNVASVIADPLHNCHQQTWGRKYWEILQAVSNKSKLSNLNYCPGAYAGYQLLRQQALAEGIAKSGKYDFVMSCVALDDRNEKLHNCLRDTGITDVSEWDTLFTGKASFGIFSHQEWVKWIREHDNKGVWMKWLSWISERYGFEKH